MDRTASRVLAPVVLTAALLGCGADGDAVVGGACKTSADCAFLDNGDACDGSFVCVAGSCALDPATVVVCDQRDASHCQVPRCDPADGACKLTHQPDGTLCDDGAPCSLGDACADGTCVGGDVSLCDCEVSADCKDDGDLCNGVPYCDTGSFPFRCRTNPATVVTCTGDGAPCTVASCDPKSGKCGEVKVADGAACDDGDACTSGDQCQGGTCAGGTDTCSCSVASDCVDPDGDPCTGVPYCDSSGGKGVCKTNPATVVTCSTQLDTACMKNLCSPTTGACALSAVKDETPCDDGDSCTKSDVCVAGQCAGGTDVCLCSGDKDCLDDGDKCNGLPFCNKATGKCETNPTTVVSCSTVADTACAKNVCVPKTGACVVLPRAEVKLLGCVEVDLGGLVGKQCLFAPALKPGKGPFPCDDSDACTTGEVCTGKACGGGKALCECEIDGDCAKKDDGDLCNGTWFCDKAVGTCKPNPASVVYCSKKDDTACEQAVCQPKTGVCGLAPVKGGASCDDGDACTNSDACDGKGACAGGAQLGCDDGDPCTVDTCDAKAGCKHAAKLCDDANDCTVDSCSPKTGQCKHQTQTDGYACNADDNGCTVADACKAGSCVAGKAMVCNGTAAPCQELKCVSAGAAKASCVPVAGDDGQPCPEAKGACLVGATCKSGKCQAGQDPRLFDRVLGKPGEASSAQDVAALPDGRLLVGGGVTTAPGKRAPRLTLLTATGEVVWQVDTKPALANSTSQIWEVAAPGDGALWSLERDTVGGRATAWLRRRATDKQLVGSVQPETSYRVLWTAGMTEVHTGGVALGMTVDGDKGSGTKYCARVARYSPLMQQLWTSLWCNDMAYDVYANKKMVIVVRRLLYGTWSGGWVGHRLETGVGTSVAFPSVQSAISAGPASGGDSVVYLRSGSTTYAWRINDTAADTGHRVKLPSGLNVSDAAAYGSDHGTALVGSKSGAPVLLRLDGESNVAWQRTVAQSGTLRAVVGAGDDMVAVGERKIGGVSRAWVVRAGPFGHTSCANLGQCAGKGAKGCDDGKPCTADSCEAKLGCLHDVKPAFTCQLADGCSRYATCASGTCQAASQGRRFATRTPWPGTRDEGGLTTAERADGRTEVFSIEAHKARRNVFSVWGNTDGTGFVSTCSGFTKLDDIDLRADGSHLLLGHSGSGSAARARYCVRSASGSLSGGGAATLLSAACSGKCAATPVDGDMAKDGTTWIAGTSAYSSTTRAFIERRSVSGGAWSKGYFFGAPTVGLGAVAFNDGGGGLLLGSGGGSAASSRLVGLGHDGKVRFTVGFPSGTWARQADTLHDGSVVAVGRSLINGTTRLFARAVSPVTGKTVWQRSQTDADFADGLAVTGLEGGGALVTGMSTLYGAKRPFLERVDSAGATVWRRTYLTGGAGGKGLSVGVWSGGFLVGTRVFVSGDPKQDQPGQIKTDRFGYAGCAAAGQCLGKTCDDKDACTTDWCDAKAGCKHAAVAGCK